ncbi:Kef-type potassium/proton antiporter (CPA2 family) [Bisgaardia hudsonensis]|uniref:Kef-type potassium/proton antiporter (CPA2 family) n=1 Tax=Bisgaardia hudsonensis TaxID=109472 RepID=A0A4R2N294_9PAST|nr:monovalent cation:proton antiporter-2 (CPA2) family protein [Bisgaardia hudsonensis]QLB12402.1 potassium transporter [Bisgaardia hudsonensis]TCP13929.1 Kef-type potassium/proton antiporter (CPA2 family) [Bisgaardia hudsonensis]
MAVENANQLVSVVTLLAAAVVAVPLFKRLGLGSILGYLVAGLVIGPFGLGFVNDSQGIIHIAELGVVMFLFIIGLEMKPLHIWGLRHHIFCLGSFQITVCMSILIGIGILYGLDWKIAFVAGAGFTLSSTAIVMQELRDRGNMTSSRSQRIISILLFEDLLIVPLLAFVTFLAPDKIDNPDPIWLKLTIPIASIAILIVIGLWLLNPLFKILAKTKIREVMTAAALLVVLGSGLLMEIGGLSMAMGAFLAGVLLSESSFRHQLEADIEPFRGLLLGLFFLSVGMSLDLAIVANNLALIVIGVLLFVLVKTSSVYLVARITGMNNASAIERAVTMSQGGEFAFVLFTAATTRYVINPEQQATMTAIVVLSMLLTPLWIILYKKYVIPNLKKESFEQESDHIEEQHPTVLIGLGRFGQVVNRLLLMTGHKPTIIDKNASLIAGMKKLGVKCYYGDASRPELLQAAGVANAELLIIAIDDKQQAIRIVELAKKINPQIKIIARAYDRVHVYDLYNAGADIQIRETFDSALRTVEKTLRAFGMEKEMAREITEVYFYKDRHNIKLTSEIYDPKISHFDNKELIRLSLDIDQEIMAEIQQIIHKED